MTSEFAGLNIDPVLLRLENPELEPGFRDPRDCLVFWARPPDHVVKLASHLQMLLRQAAPSKHTRRLGSRGKAAPDGLTPR